MKSINEIEVLFENNLKNTFNKFEKKRIFFIILIFIFLIIALCICLLCLILFVKQLIIYNYEKTAIYCIIILNIWIFYYLFVNFLLKKYKKKFKENIIKRIIKSINEKIDYKPDSYVPKEYFLLSKLYDKYPTKYSGEDLIKGKIDNTRFIFSEIKAQREYKSKYYSFYKTFFKGIFFIADFNKKFKGKVFILPDKYEKKFGTLIGDQINKQKTNLGKFVKMEDLDFEKEFVVYGNDQIESRYILSTNLLKRITDYKKKKNKKISLSFIKNSILIAIEIKKNLFEPHIFDSLIKFDTIKKYFKELKLGLDIIEELKLNRKIWEN